MKLGGGWRNGQRKSEINFSADPDKAEDPGILCLGVVLLWGYALY